jgi:hypothetical protein
LIKPDLLLWSGEDWKKSTDDLTLDDSTDENFDDEVGEGEFDGFLSSISDGHGDLEG